MDLGISSGALSNTSGSLQLRIAAAWGEGLCHQDHATANYLEAGGRGNARRSRAETGGAHSGSAPARYAPVPTHCPPIWKRGPFSSAEYLNITEPPSSARCPHPLTLFPLAAPLKFSQVGLLNR